MRLALEANPDGTMQLVVQAPLADLAEAADLARALETLCGGAQDSEISRQDAPGTAAGTVDGPEYPANALEAK